MKTKEEIQKEVKTLKGEKSRANERITAAEKLIIVIDNQLDTLQWILEEENK